MKLRKMCLVRVLVRARHDSVRRHQVNAILNRKLLALTVMYEVWQESS